jgi:hypothetical protein
MPTERRKNPRLLKNLPFKVKFQECDVAIESMDISCNGISCKVDEYIPEMTRLEILLVLPSVIDYEGRVKAMPQEVKCEGVVIRVEEEHDLDNTKFYNTAIYFDNISEEEKQKILGFVMQEIEKGQSKQV